MIDLKENRLIPLIPCPLVHPLLNLVPKPTMAPPIINKTNELNASNYLYNLRKKNKLFFSLSFESISAVGKHAAIPHYRLTKKSNLALTIFNT